jgi:hypothetical protein
MATPFPNVSKGDKDNYNFFQSQVRCLRLLHDPCIPFLFFLILFHSHALHASSFVYVLNAHLEFFVNRWALLRSIIPPGISIAKTIAPVVALAKLHNFCIDEADKSDTTSNKYDEPDSSGADPDPDRFSAPSRNCKKKQKCLELIAAHEKDYGVEDVVPTDLLDGGKHRRDHPRGTRKRDDTRTVTSRGDTLPRESMLQVVIDSGKVQYYE